MIAVDLAVRCTDNSCWISPYGFVLRDREGFEYSRNLMNQKQPILPMDIERRLGRGETLRGWLTFEIPISATGLSIHAERGVIYLR